MLISPSGLQPRPAGGHGIPVAWHFDPVTLREVVDDREGALRELTRAEGGDRVWLLRLLGRVDEARSLGEELLAAAADPFRPLLLLADVLCAQQDYDGARSLQERALLLCPENRRREATVRQHIGKRLFDQGSYEAAAQAFAAALALREADGDLDLIASSTLALSRARTVAGGQVRAAGPDATQPNFNS